MPAESPATIFERAAEYGHILLGEAGTVVLAPDLPLVARRYLALAATMSGGADSGVVLPPGEGGMLEDAEGTRTPVPAGGAQWRRGGGLGRRSGSPRWADQAQRPGDFRDRVERPERSGPLGDLAHDRERLGAEVAVLREARLAAARVAMRRLWERNGGPRSIVGLPLGDRIEVRELGHQGADGYEAHFRGGPMRIRNDGSGAGIPETVTVVNISLVGIECQIRQEKTDEVYGVASVLGPSGGLIASHRFPGAGTLQFGPQGMRLANVDVPIVTRGILQPHYVWVSLIEHDSGDVDVIAQKIAGKFAEAAAAGLGAATGAPAESVAESESFKENMATGLAWVFGSVLGMGDDPYNAASFALPWPDLKRGRFEPQPPVRRADDPRAIAGWTHRVTATGIDDGGDVGQYAFYFRVGTETHTWVPNP